MQKRPKLLFGHALGSPHEPLEPGEERRSTRHHHPPRVLAVSACALCCAAHALATGGNIVFDGGSPAEQAQVKMALAVSSFDFNVLPRATAVHIAPLAAGSYATPGNVYLDSVLLDSGEFSWGVVQHEFGHQVDFALLHDDDRARLQSALHAKDWCYEVPGLQHADNGCERFASELAWAYWPSSQNSMQPADIGNESDGMPPVAFRALLAQLLQTAGTSTETPVPATAPTLILTPRLPSPKATTHGIRRRASIHPVKL